MVQQKELERVGGSKTIHVNVRIIAATHQNLEQMVVNKKFREDLWYRLNAFPIIIPPLRQRQADLPALVAYFLRLKSRELNFRNIPSLAPGAIDRLMDYPWKGNVRELENLVERTLIQYNGGLLQFDHFVFPQTEGAPPLANAGTKMLTLDEADTRHIQSALEATRGRINGPDGVAALLGIHPSTLRCRMNKLGIIYGRKRTKGAIP
jgi:transcriptional regulator with GAF, ATPase, and Fis domain